MQVGSRPSVCLEEMSIHKRCSLAEVQLQLFLECEVKYSQTILINHNELGVKTFVTTANFETGFFFLLRFVAYTHQNKYFNLPYQKNNITYKFLVMTHNEYNLFPEKEFIYFFNITTIKMPLSLIYMQHANEVLHNISESHTISLH